MSPKAPGWKAARSVAVTIEQAAAVPTVTAVAVFLLEPTGNSLLKGPGQVVSGAARS